MVLLPMTACRAAPMVPHFGVTDEDGGLIAFQIHRIGAFDDHISGLQRRRHVKNRFPQKPFALHKYKVSRERFACGPMIHLMSGRGRNSPQKTLPGKPLFQTGLFENFFGHIPIGTAGQYDQRSFHQRMRHFRQRGRGLADQALAPAATVRKNWRVASSSMIVCVGFIDSVFPSPMMIPSGFHFKQSSIPFPKHISSPFQTQVLSVVNE